MQDGKHVILCVDDDQDIRDSMELFLKAQGYEPVVAGSAEAGLRACKDRKPDLVIVDLMMEEIDSGAGLVKELKALGCQAPVFLLSSVGDSLNMMADYTELGLDGVLQKPVNFDALLAILKEKLK